MTSLIRLRLYLRRHRTALLVAVVCVFCANGIGLLGPLVLQRAIDSLGRRTAGPALWQYAVLIVLVALVNNSFNFGMRWMVSSTSQRIEYELRNDLFRHFQRLELAFFQDSKVGDLVARATNDLSTVRRMLGPGISSLINTAVAFSITMVAMALLDLRLTLISGVFLPLMTAIFVFLGRHIERAYRRVQDQFGDLSARAQENFSGIRVVKAYVQEDHEIASFGRLNWQYVTRSMHYARLTGGLWPAMTLVGGLSVTTLLWVGGNDVIAHRLSLGQFVQFNAYLGQLAWPMISLGWSFNLFQQGDASLNRIREITERPPAITDRAHPVAPRRVEGEITFSHVSLSYDGHEVLHDVNLHVPAGQTLAVVGPTGVGKTSLLNLIPRVFDATSGHVLVDGVDVRDWPLEALRRQVGYVTQETFLFSLPISENVAYGVDAATAAQVEAAATIAQLSRDVADFPQGYATTIGERGVTLSGGQKQRAAIARAVLKNPRILLLDDALSSVDTHTEEEILRRLRGVVEGRTSLIVSHRISTVRAADAIVVLDEGRIVEQGTHEQLVVRAGLYAAMYRRQLLSEELDVEIDV